MQYSFIENSQMIFDGCMDSLECMDELQGDNGDQGEIKY
jgi:hypothetical protein